MAWFRLGGAGISAALKNAMNAVFNKKLGTSQEYAPNSWPDNVNLMGMLEERTASGAIAHIDDGAEDVPLKNWLVTLPASLDGYSSVTAYKAKKNLLPNELTSQTLNGTTFTVNADGSITVSGTPSAQTRVYICRESIEIKVGMYFSFGTMATGTRVFVSRTSGGSTTYPTISPTHSATLDATYTNFLLEINTTFDGTPFTVYPMLEVGSTATSYEAYTAPTQYTAELGRTIYGGEVDIVNGTGQEGEAKIKFNELTWTYNSQYGRFQANDLISVIKTPSSNNEPLAGLIAEGYITTVASAGSAQDRGIAVTTVSGYLLVYDSRYTDVTTFLSAEGEKNIVYPLDTPEAFTFEPITPTPETALGVNNFWADEGDSDVTYRSSGTVTPVPIQPTLISKTITENGTYSAEDDDADGYSEVTVNVQGGETPFVPLFTETKIADNSSHASSFTLSEDYGNYDMVKIVWWESASSSGFLYTTPDILDEIFSVGAGKLCINKPSTNYYVCYGKSGLTWTQTNQRNIYVHEVYGVSFTNCTMTATDLYRRGASTTTKYAVTSQTSLKDYDLFMMASIHNTDGSETMPTTWLYQYPPENMSEAFSCPVPTVLQEYNANDEAFVISEYGMTSARYFMVQGITFTPTPSLLSMGGFTSSNEEPTEPENNEEEEEE